MSVLIRFLPLQNSRCSEVLDASRPHQYPTLPRLHCDQNDRFAHVPRAVQELKSSDTRQRASWREAGVPYNPTMVRHRRSE